MTLALLVEILARRGGSASSSDGTLLLLGPVGGALVYFFLWRYYRNAYRSHSFERETRVVAQPVTGYDRKVGEVTGVRNKSILGNNGHNHRERVQRVP